ncbi:proteasome accessory factor PafA2 [Alloscardovia macacae]|uniref:Proteasome accessory factor PafA2 n=1 Tax=Alloscardovia macacae TaxID=1160091 RepID=A0A1Y2T3F5_9BIFI|nr:depupylase/deamidase Dop [Alloscardovia macacae]OTA30018.1 proteasome accessory factor PafA2 [Alloscardovia macacae]
MSVRRVMGTETEYGISARGGEYENHAQLSFDVIQAVAQLNPRTQHVRWDYGSENPVQDARGYAMPRAHVRSDLLTDSPALRATNAPQVNGARVYVDHAHPEYSSPEVLTPRDAVTYNRSGDEIMRRALETSGQQITLYRSNVDGKGASWGSHENYLVERSVPFEQLATLFTVHAATRQIFTGSGRVGLGQASEEPGFQISQRADYFTQKVGLQTTFDRPIVNTRDEPHASDAYRRFHVIVGDANRMDVPELLKVGTTSLLFWALEHDANPATFLESIALADPVSALHDVSHDLSVTQTYRTLQGEELSAVQFQLRLRSWVYAVAASTYDTDSRGEPLWPDDDTKEVVALWTQVLKDLLKVSKASADERLSMTEEAGRLEWLLKWQILESMRRRKATHWSSPLLKAMDISWGSLAQSSLWEKVASRSQRLISQGRIDTAAKNPPEDTRAYTRGRVLAERPEEVIAVSWDTVTLADGVLHMDDPYTFTAQHKIDSTNRS